MHEFADKREAGLRVTVELSSNDAIVVGPPNVLSSWGLDLVRAAAAQLLRAEIRWVDRNDVVEEVPTARSRARVIFLSQYPSPSLAGIIRNSHIPAIAFLDEPIDSVRYLKESTHCSFLEALRAQTAAATICCALFGNSSVLLINRSAGGTVGGVGGRILDQLGLAKTIASKFIEQFAGEAGAASWPLERILSRRVVGYAAPGKACSITAEEAAVIDQVLSPMTLMAVHRDVEPISWPSSVFLYGDRPNERAPLVADVTGAARVIFYGPYFHLPPGRWQVQIVLGFSHDIFGTPFSIEVHGSELVAKTVVKPDGGGIFRASFSMTHTRPQDPLELRIRNEEGAIEGRIGLARARFFPQAH